MITGSLWVLDRNIWDQVMVKASSQVLVWLETLYGSSGPIKGSFSKVPQVPKGVRCNQPCRQSILDSCRQVWNQVSLLARIQGYRQ